jgi:tRNA(adenine34) deaminase
LFNLYLTNTIKQYLPHPRRIIMVTDMDLKFLRHAVKLARDAQKHGNLPIGAVITLDDEIIGQGQNSIWSPSYRPNRHAEIEAIESIKIASLWDRCAEMTLYTTLEPCLMCAGAILVHRIGRIIFGANDTHGGAVCIFGHMPYAFENLRRFTQWFGPALPDECNELSDEVIRTVKRRNNQTP